MIRPVKSPSYKSIADNGLHVIHCDLWHDNIKRYKSQLAPFDFEDTILGYRLHDIAMALLDLAEAVGAEEYARLFKNFHAGNASVTLFPSGDLLGLQPGRLRWLTNRHARYAGDHLLKAARFRLNVIRRALAALPVKPSSGTPGHPQPASSFILLVAPQGGTPPTWSLKLPRCLVASQIGHAFATPRLDWQRKIPANAPVDYAQ